MSETNRPECIHGIGLCTGSCQREPSKELLEAQAKVDAIARQVLELQAAKASQPPPESAEPAPVATDTQAREARVKCTCGTGSDEDCGGPHDHMPPCPAASSTTEPAAVDRASWLAERDSALSALRDIAEALEAPYGHPWEYLAQDAVAFIRNTVRQSDAARKARSRQLAAASPIEPAAVDRAALTERAARLVRDYVAGENVDELMHQWVDDWDSATGESYRASDSASHPAEVAAPPGQPSVEAQLIALMQETREELGLEEENGEHCPILEALNQAHNIGAQRCASRFARQGLLREQPATPAPTGDAEVRLFTDEEHTELSELAARLSRWCRKNYLLDKGLPEELHELEEFLHGRSFGKNGDAYVSLERRQRLEAEARQQQAEREVAAALEELAVWRRDAVRYEKERDEAQHDALDLRATLQNKDEEIAELNTDLDLHKRSRLDYMTQRDELSRKLEAADVVLAEANSRLRVASESNDLACAKLEAAERGLSQLAARNDIAERHLYNIGATRGDVATRAETARRIYDARINDDVVLRERLETIADELAQEGQERNGPADYVTIAGRIRDALAGRDCDPTQQNKGQDVGRVDAPPDQPPPAEPLTEDDVGLGQLCVACGAHWMTDAQLDKLNDAIAPWRSRALAAEAKLAEAAKEQVTRDDDCPPDGHAVSVYASENGDTLAFPGSLFTTVRACIDCGVLINGGPTRCLTCADKPLTRADVKAIVAEVAERGNGLGNCDEPALLKLAKAAKE